MKKLNAHGFASHLLIPVLAIVVVAGLGAYLINGSKAATPSKFTSTATTSTQDTTQQKLAALTSVIDGLKAGGTAGITVTAVTVPGPISNAQARPIIFGVKGGGMYFAYRQSIAPDFNQTSAATAQSMAIVPIKIKYKTTYAHLNKSNVLVDANSINDMVGYSVGGTGTGK